MTGVRLIDHLDRVLRLVTEKSCIAAGWGLVILSAVVVVNIITRKFFNISIQGVDEYGGYCLAISASFGFAQAAYEKAHVRISILTDRLPISWRAVSDVVALILLTLVAVLLAVKAFDTAMDSYHMRARATSALRTPLIYPQAIWAAALCWFAFVLSIQFIRSVLMLAQRNWAGIERDYGAASVDEEVEKELETAKARMLTETAGDKQ